MPEEWKPVDRADELTNRILAHYGATARVLPWRSPPGGPLPDPYHVWLSEIMLQQTTVAAVKPYFAAFLARWPEVGALAVASDADVMQAWAGLGYYARARNLLACARAITAQFGGAFPQEEHELLSLPGIGAYTAAAISSIAFGRRAVVVDGNVERVITRLFALETPLPKAKAAISRYAELLTPKDRAGDFAQAMMDLGATICTPKSPNCPLCPLLDRCEGKSAPDRFPVKLPKTPKPERTGVALWLMRGDAVYLIRRPDRGLLGGMRALPSWGWDGSKALIAEGPFEAAGSITHAFTHFRLTLNVLVAQGGEFHASGLQGEWWPIDQIDKAGLPSVFMKAAQRAMGGLS